MIAALLIASALVATPPHVVSGQTVFVPSSHVVTQFAVPVAVPQFASPIAPQSFVQYGTHSLATPRSDLATVGKEIAEIKAMLLEATKSGAITGLVIPTLVKTHCAKCHGPVDPKAGLDLSTLDKLTPQQRLRSIERMLADDEGQRMPPPSAGATPISADDLGKLIQEFSKAGEAAKPAAKP
jgi:hypothetical protein